MARWSISPEFAVSVVSSVLLHAGWLMSEAQASSRTDPQNETIIETETVQLPPPPAPKETPAPPPEETTRPEPKAASAPAREAAAAPPPAAQAGKTLTAPEQADDSSVADFTMVQGAGETYSGGTTTSRGTSTTAVRGPASDKPVVAAPRAAVAAPVVSAPAGPDRSRGATPAYSDWNCSRLFPNDPEAGDQAAVLIAVTVLPDGSPKSVAVLRDPGHGFGAAARTCAMGQRFNSAFDRGGNPILATTPPITVRFTR